MSVYGRVHATGLVGAGGKNAAADDDDWDTDPDYVVCALSFIG